MTLKTGPADDDAYGVASRCAVAVRRPHGDDGLFLIGFMFRVLIGLSILGIGLAVGSALALISPTMPPPQLRYRTPGCSSA